MFKIVLRILLQRTLGAGPYLHLLEQTPSVETKTAPTRTLQVIGTRTVVLM